MMMQRAKSVGRATSSAASSTTARTWRGPLPLPFRARRRATCSTMITAPSTMIPKSTAPRERRFAERPRSFKVEERAEQRERDDERHHQRGAETHQEDAHHEHDEERAEHQVVGHRGERAPYEPGAVV